MNAKYDWDHVYTGIEIEKDSIYHLLEKMTISFLESIGVELPDGDEIPEDYKEVADYVFGHLSYGASKVQDNIDLPDNAEDYDYEYTVTAIREIANYSGVEIDHNLNLKACAYKFEFDKNLRYDMSDADDREEFEQYQFLSEQPLSGISILVSSTSYEHGAFVECIDLLRVNSKLTAEEKDYNLLNRLLTEDIFSEFVGRYDKLMAKKEKERLEKSTASNGKISITKKL